MTELELVRAARAGDEGAFETLVRTHEKKIYNLCLRLCGNSDDAADAAQEAFVSAWRALPFFREESNFATWLYRLATNASIDLLRREKRHRAPVSLDDEEQSVDAVDESASPDELYEKKELRAAVLRAMEGLSDEQRRILILRELQQLSYQEIAEIMDMELGTVKTRIHRARKNLRNALVSSGTFLQTLPSKEVEDRKPKQKGDEEQ
ncbi:MAG: sigma-70 family RNA polymerase sigma factor [Oscillospiraceae bacterium]|nr:sigma-70 family RNA polymerase sigma factor [Oscillospiraceae bacterium]